MNYIKKIIRKLNMDNNQGMTMVEIMMGFTVLMVLLGGLSSIISFSSNLYMNCVDIKRAQEEFQAEIYKNNNEGTKHETSLKFVGTLSSAPKTKTAINTDMYVYSIYSGQIVNQETNINLDMTYYYIGTDKAGGSNP